MAGQDTFWLPRAGSTIAKEVDFGWNLVLTVSAIFFLIVVGAMIYLVVRYQRRNENEVPHGPEHNTKLEVVWTGIPIAIVMVLFAVGFKTFLSMAVAPAESLEVSVTAERWLWTFTYPNGTVSVNELRAPVNQPVKLVMSSKDVIHSFYVPDFRIKKDVVPNQYTTTWFEATEAGEATLMCAEYCGTGHSAMLGKIVIQQPKEFQDWLDSAGADAKLPPAEAGAKLFVKMSCNTCHTTDGSPKTGPTFKGVFGRTEEMSDGQKLQVDEQYIRESIETPAAKVVKGYQPVMPVFKGLLNQKQIDALIAYIKTLK